MNSSHNSGPQRPSLVLLYAALWSHASGRRWLLIAAYALLVLAETSLLLVPWLTGKAIDILQVQGRAGLTEAGWLLLGVVATVVVSWVLHFPGRILERNVALHVRRSYSMQLLQKLLHAPLSWHQSLGSTEISQRVSQSSGGLHGFAETQYVYIENAVKLFGPFVALTLIAPWIGVVATLGFGGLLLASLGLDRILVALNVKANAVEREYQSTWVELMSHALTLKALRKAIGAQRMVSQGLSRLDALMRRIVVLNEIKWGSVDVVGAALTCALVALFAGMTTWSTAGTAAGAGLALGSLYMVYEYARRAQDVVSLMAGDFGVMASQLADHHSGGLILSAPQEASLPALSATSWKRLALTDVDMGRSRLPAPTQWTLALQSGKRYALVGASGTGKSSLLRLLAGIEFPSCGSVSLDGERVPFEALRREATLISQEAQLFTGTLRDNLCDEPLSEEGSLLLAEALFSADALELLQRSTLGLDAPVAEDGRDWSGGQRQRLALARGLLASRGSSLVLIDEPTSALDAQQAHAVLERTLLFVRPACVVVAIHHLELLDQFDEVIVLEAGGVVDAGPVAEVRFRCKAMQRLMLSLGSTPSPQNPVPAAMSGKAGPAIQHFH